MTHIIERFVIHFFASGKERGSEDPRSAWISVNLRP